MKTNKFYKLLSQALKKSDLKRFLKNMVVYSDSNSDSYSESDTSSEQEIRRSNTISQESHNGHRFQVQEAPH